MKECTFSIEFNSENRGAGVQVPEELTNLLKKNSKAKQHFDKISCSHQKEYVNYITEAKKEETKLLRAAKTIKMLEQNRKR